MKTIRWMLLVGFVTFILGGALLVLNYDKIGMGLGIAGFSLALLGIVGGNWVAARSHENTSYGVAHRIALIGFCISVVGIVGGDFLPALGNTVMIGGLCVMFFGFIFTMWKISKG